MFFESKNIPEDIYREKKIHIKKVVELWGRAQGFSETETGRGKEMRAERITENGRRNLVANFLLLLHLYLITVNPSWCQGMISFRCPVYR